jgi:hypothetical protein
MSKRFLDAEYYKYNGANADPKWDDIPIEFKFKQIVNFHSRQNQNQVGVNLANIVIETEKDINFKEKDKIKLIQILDQFDEPRTLQVISVNNTLSALNSWNTLNWAGRAKDVVRTITLQ